MIKVSPNFGIESDGNRNIIIMKRVDRKDGEEGYTAVAWHRNVADALSSILKKEELAFVESYEGEDIRELVRDLKQFERETLGEMLRRVEAND